MTCRARAYADSIPAESAEFNKMLDAFYSRHGKTVSPPIVDGVLLNLEAVFRAVASRGGNEAVTLNKFVISEHHKFTLFCNLRFSLSCLHHCGWHPSQRERQSASMLLTLGSCHVG